MRVKLKKLGLSIVLIASFSSILNGQESNSNCNIHTAIITSNGFTLAVDKDSDLFTPNFQNESNLIGDTLDAATFIAAISIGAAWVQVTDSNAISGNEYPAGSYAGFVVDDNSISTLLSGVTVSTLLGGSVQESVSDLSLLTVGLPGSKGRVGFYTSMPFDGVRITYSGLGLGTFVSVYYAEVRKLCSGATFVLCGGSPGSGEVANNTDISISGPDFPAVINYANTGFTGASLGSISNEENAVDNDPNSYAELDLTSAVLGSVEFSVLDTIDSDFNSGTYAGFDLEFAAISGVNLIGGLSIKTYQDGVLKETFSGLDLLTTNSSLIGGFIRQTVGFVTSMNYDEIQMKINKISSASVGITRIYNAVIKNFCSGSIANCSNIPSATTNPDFPVYIDWNNTGIGLTNICTGCTIDNTNNVIDSDQDNFATVVIAANSGSSLQLTVGHEINEYNPNTFAGFEIATGSLLSTQILGSATITLYNNGASVQSSTGNALLVGTSTTILDNGLSRQPVGIISTDTFDAVGISFQDLTGVDIGEIRIYNALFSDSCPGIITCYQSNFWTHTDFPAYINSERTGVSGLVGSSEITDVWNVVSSTVTDFATVSVTSDVVAGTSISVVDAVTEYPIGTFAGYTIETTSNDLVGVDLLDGITITTYNNGVEKESENFTTKLVGLELSGILTINPDDKFINVGFVTEHPFDEIQITFSGITDANVFDDPTRVYGAFFDTRYVTSGPFACPQITLNPDFNESYVNLSVAGALSTNDQVSTSSAYGTVTANPGNPALATTFILNNDGTYVFEAPTAGIYKYEIEVCVMDGPSPCPTSTLTITINDQNISANPPFVNPDYGSGYAGDPIILATLKNDVSGNDGVDLDKSSVSIISQPKNGMVTIDGSTGDITYTPNKGYVGLDSLIYKVCDALNNCSTAFQEFTVYPKGYENTTDAIDDLAIVPPLVWISGNVSINDLDPEGDLQSVIPQNLIVPGIGTLILLSNGDYTFIPDPSFTGPYSFDYQTCDIQGACAIATLHLLAKTFFLLMPDFNTTFNNVPVNGDMGINDDIPTGATYGTPIADAGNPEIATFTLNSNGSYDFQASTPGIYLYNVPVCVVEGPTPCPSTLLRISVNESGGTSNPPFVNPDYGAGMVGAPITLQTLENDASGNLGTTLDTSSLMIINIPSNGSTSIGPDGDITYTPNPGFIGMDTLTYQVCDNSEAPGPYCATAIQVFTVLHSNTNNITIAADDGYIGIRGAQMTGNVSNNDIDPNGDTQSTTPQTTTTAEGTFVLDSAGNFTFTPDANFTGPVHYTYTTCDDGTPQACDVATAYFLVMPSTDLEVDMTIGVSASIVSINIGGSSQITYNITNVGPDPSTGLIEVIINRRTENGTMTPSLVPIGWGLAETTATFWRYTTTNLFNANGVTAALFTFDFTHDGDSETLILVFRGSVISGSGGEIYNLNNIDIAKIQVNQ